MSGWGAIIQAGTGIAGAGISAYGASRRAAAMRDANAAYEDALGQESARQERRTTDDVQRGYDWALEDQEGTGKDVEQLLASPAPEAMDPKQFLMSQQAAVERGRAAAPVQGINQGGQPTTAQAQWGQAVGGQNAERLDRFQRGMSRDWAERRAADRQDAILTDRAIRRLVAARGRADVVQREQLDDMIGRLAWARQQRQLQNRMNQAEGTGAEQMMWGQTLGAAGQAAGSAVSARESKADPTTTTTPAK